MSVKLSATTSRLLDVLRGTAALLVVAGHSREYASKIYGLNNTGDSLLEKILLIPSSFAMEAVAVFFVLSGFLVGGQVIREVQNGRFNWAAFLAKRLSRLWMVLLPGIAFTWLMWEWAIAGTDLPGFGISPAALSAIGNGLFLQEVLCDSFANNAALWSISYEFWFYIVFAGSMVGLSRMKEKPISAVLNIMIVVGSIWLFGVKLLALIPAWLIGAFISWKYSPSYGIGKFISKQPTLWLLFSILMLTVFAICSNLLNLNREKLTIFLSFPSALYIMAAIVVAGEDHRIKRLIDLGVKLGQGSFSVYIYHLPLVIAILYWLKNNVINQANLVLMTYGTILLTLPPIVLLWWLTERKTVIARNLAMSWVRAAAR